MSQGHSHERSEQPTSTDCPPNTPTICFVTFLSILHRVQPLSLHRPFLRRSGLMCCGQMKDTKLHIVGLEALDVQVRWIRNGQCCGANDEPWQLQLCCMGGCVLLFQSLIPAQSKAHNGHTFLLRAITCPASVLRVPVSAAGKHGPQQPRLCE
jgi:hypothetical protein